MIRKTRTAPPSEKARLRSARRKPEVRSSGLAKPSSHIDLISGAAIGVDELRRETMVDLAAQPADMRLDDRRLRHEAEAPYIFQQHGAGDDLALTQHQIFEQLIFPWFQLDLAACAPNPAAQPVEFEIGDLQPREF